jgi:hypothetical protein
MLTSVSSIQIAAALVGGYLLGSIPIDQFDDAKP